MPSRRPLQTGFSLVEALIPLTIAGVLLGGALPSLDSFKQRRQLEGSAAQLATDLQLARSAVVAANSVLRMDFVNADGRSCYVLHDGPARSCSCGRDGIPVCADGTTALRSAHFVTGHAVQLRSNVASIGFDPIKGTVTPTASIRLDAPVGQLRLVVNVMGRIRSCAGTGDWPGQRRC